ncbi:type IV pilin [Natranaeroarchaeum aerophilus]|uniref:Type IV pilin N-terminal domain-containing protein n=1 Tax=Natranaeroarchaeum aerophilus TaxID=2917711 RepID=A0AAE3FPE0_9EURY|nr:type IV pilin N-terminal domain-containing protein [Natranaeroarchaeum aerophilus]MCL9812645.1 type IV pilin N-terminal domain-containing protein [Natranaeroarchaeum aerophilus]
MVRIGGRARDRGVSPVIGVVLLVALTILLAGIAAGGLITAESPDPRPTVVVDASAEPTTNTVTVRHVRGGALDPSALSLQIAVNGTELDKQPPIPFFSAHGFVPGPTGPFNPETDSEWTAGETGTVRIASTNDPAGIEGGDRVGLTLVYGDHVLAETTVTAR